ncbi:MAG: hypothetical protein A2157_18330 [Deltaproteobacteria bacterium RBG_16_47_11]|nr:MAG: hypothetical protein A2157_18330 [Deltaproteobacteria bacterium RBG_16_47_11]
MVEGCPRRKKTSIDLPNIMIEGEENNLSHQEAVSQSQTKGARQSGFKALECGSFRLWEIVACIKSNVFIPLARLILNG